MYVYVLCCLAVFLVHLLPNISMKPKDPVWNFFTQTEGKTSAKCKQCSADVSAKVLRLKAHREKCPALSRVPQGGLKRVLEDAQDPPIPSVDEDQQPAQKRPRLQQSSVTHFGLTTDRKQKVELDMQIARMFYACNIPFNVVSHPEFQRMVEMLRPGYQAPTRKALAGDLLDSVHEKITCSMKEELKGKEVTMMQDGWSDIHNTPVIASTLHCQEKSYFLSAVDTGANKKTAEYCTSVAKDAIQEASDKFECTVTGVVTDNEKKMQAMRTSLKLDNPSLEVYGCSAHWLNLLGQSVTPSQVINQVVEINKYFRNHHIPGALLNEMPGSVKPQLPAATRWNSQLHCLETYTKNRPFMLLVVAQHEELIDVRIKNLIHNVGLLNESKHLLQQLQPISKALDELQSDTATVADSCEQWLDLLQCPSLEPHKKQVQTRMDQAMTPCHYLANLLHPVYRGKKLQPDHINAAQECLLEINPEVLPELLNFMADSLALPKAMLHAATISKTKPTVWWTCVQRIGTVNPALCKIALKLLSLPCSSASLERVFSNFSVIQNKLRNRLGIEKASKLVVCYRFLRGKEELEW